MKFTDDAGTLSVDPLFAQQIEKESQEQIRKCLQCGECTAGCPLAFSMDYTPNQIMRLAQLGLKERLLKSSAIWTCASCSTCLARCPRNIDLPRVMDTLRGMAYREGIKAPSHQIPIFHETFLESVKAGGRTNELMMMAQYKLKSRQFTQDVPMGIRMFLMGKMGLKSEKVQKIDEVRRLFKKSGGTR